MERDRFERLTAADIVAMKGDVEDRRLDCKTVESGDFTSSNDKGNLAKAISGFANAEGGVVLWGVSAKKNNEGIDCIESFPGVRDPERLRARLQELTSQATSPGVVGVVHRIPSAERVRLYFVATFVPQSDSGPHMAKLGEDRYYQRIGSSMMRMEHFQIADMFGRRAHPEIEFKFVQSSSDALSIELRNVGRGIARAPYVMLRVRRPYIAAPFPETGNVKDFPLPRLPNASMPDWGAFVGGMDQVIHPGVTLRFRAVALPPQFQGPVPTNCYVEEYRIGAAGATERAGRYEFDFKNGSFTNMGDGYGDW